MRILFVFALMIQVTIYGQQSDFNSIDFHKADSIAYGLEGASLKNLPLLTYQLTHQLKSDAEKFKAIYLWICTNIENDYTSYLRTKKKRKKIEKDEASFLEWNKGYTPKMFERMVEEKKTACTGYAYLIKEMANLAGLKCEIVNGFGRVLNANLTASSVPNHSWNAIQLNQKWYLCDATWSAGTFVINDGIATFKKEYIDGYFLTKPAHFAKNHYPVDKKWLLTEIEVDFEDFLSGPLLYKDAFQLGVFPKLPNLMNQTTKKGAFFDLILESGIELEEGIVLFMMNNGNKTQVAIPNIEQTKEGYLLRHRFEHRGGHDLHLNVRGKPIATYVIKVTK